MGAVGRKAARGKGKGMTGRDGEARDGWAKTDCWRRVCKHADVSSTWCPPGTGAEHRTVVCSRTSKVQQTQYVMYLYHHTTGGRAGIVR